METQGTAESCSCAECQAACRFKPGWFTPGEAERVADYLGVSLSDLFRTRLMVDRWGRDRVVFVLSPAVVEVSPGQEFLSTTRGQCVFYQAGRCTIHPVKPFECRAMLHGRPATYHAETAHAWDTPAAQGQIRRLLGREPIAEEVSILDSLFGRHGSDF